MKLSENQKMLGIGLAVAAVLAFYLYTKEDEPKPENQPDEKGKETNKLDADGNPIFPLKNGSRGEEVTALQKYLNNSASCQKKAVQVSNPNARMKPLFPLDEDGIFGDKTESILTQCYGSPIVSEDNFNSIKTMLENKKVV